jgi:hypothetical protein
MIFSNFYEEYPVTHPKVRVYDLPVNWSKPGDMTTDLDGQLVPLRGLIKCEVVPPRHPKHGIPVLPMRIGERLHFSLCRSCSHQYKKGGTKMPGYHCPHYEDNERGKFLILSINSLSINFSIYRNIAPHRAPKGTRSRLQDHPPSQSI